MATPTRKTANFTASEINSDERNPKIFEAADIRVSICDDRMGFKSMIFEN